MSNFGEKAETGIKIEAPETTNEASLTVEVEQTNEEIRQEISRRTAEEVEVVTLQSEIVKDLADLQTGLLEGEEEFIKGDTAELQGLCEEASVAKAELVAVVADNNVGSQAELSIGKKETISGDDHEKVDEKTPALIARAGMEKIHSMFAAGQQESSEYKTLSAALMKQENRQSVWKSGEEIDAAAVEGVLRKVDQDETFNKAKELVERLHAEGKNTSSEYFDLYSNLTEGFGENLKWRAVGDIDAEKVKKMIDAIEKPSEEEAQEIQEDSGINSKIDIITEEESSEHALKEENASAVERIEKPAHGSMEYYLQKSKITDKNEAISKLMQFAGVDSEEALIDKFKERDDEKFVIADMDLFIPDLLENEPNPSVSFLKKVRDTGDALGYTFANTPGYEMQISDTISKLRSKGREDQALEVEKIFKEDMQNFENEKEKSSFKKIDENLFELLKDEEAFRAYIEEQKKLPPEAIVQLYHGLNNGGYDGALDILNGSAKGIEQRSGPTLSFAPLGQFWKGVGFRYAIRRDQIEFPGEKNPNAVVQIKRGDDGIDDTGYIIDKSGSLPLDRFDAEVMRSGFVLPNPDLEKELLNKLNEFSAIRKEKNNLE